MDAIDGLPVALLKVGSLQAPSRGEPLAPTLAEWLVEQANTQLKSPTLPLVASPSADGAAQPQVPSLALTRTRPADAGKAAGNDLLGSSVRAQQRQRHKHRASVMPDVRVELQALQGSLSAREPKKARAPSKSQASYALSARGVRSSKDKSASQKLALGLKGLQPGGAEEAPLILPRITAWRSPRPGTFATVHGCEMPDELEGEGSEWGASTAYSISQESRTMMKSTSTVSLSARRPFCAMNQTDRKWHIRQASISAVLSRSGEERAASPSRSPPRTASGAGGKYLFFEGWGIDDAYLRSLTKHVDLSQIRNMDLTGNRLTAASLADFSKSSRQGAWGALQSLRLARNRLGHEGGKLFARFLQTCRPPLQELDLADNSLGDTASHNICEAVLSCCYTLVGLSLAQNSIGQSDGAAVGSALESLMGSLSSLQALDLHWNSIGGVSAACVMQGLQDNATQLGGQLWRVNLAWNRVGTRCNASQVQSARERATGGFKAGRDCRCDLCRATTRAVATLAGVFSDCSVLFHLDLAYNGLCAEDCATLASGLRRNHTLFGLHLDGNEASVDDCGFILPQTSHSQEDFKQLLRNEELRNGINDHVRHTPWNLNLQNVGSVSRAPDKGPVREKVREMLLGREANPSLKNLHGPEAFSSSDVEAEREWVGVRTRVQRCAEFGDGRRFEDVRLHERSCWICENWVSVDVHFIPGWSCPAGLVQSVDAIFAYFSIDGFTRPIRLSKMSEKYRERDFRLGDNRLMSQLTAVGELQGPADLDRFTSPEQPSLRRRVTRRRSNHGIELIAGLADAADRAPMQDGSGRYAVYRGSRMLPPSTLPVKVIFQVGEAFCVADDLPQEALPSPVVIKRHAEGRVSASLLPPIPVEMDSTETVGRANVMYIGKKALHRFALGQANALCLLEDPRLREDLAVVPRKLQYDKAASTEHAWKLSSSSFKDFPLDTEDLISRCFDYDYSLSRLPKLFRDAQSEEAFCTYMRSNYQRLMCIFHQHAMRGFTSAKTTPGLGMLEFGELLNRSEARAALDFTLDNMGTPGGDQSPQSPLAVLSKANRRMGGVSFANQGAPRSRSQSISIAPATSTKFRSEADLIFVSANVVDQKLNKGDAARSLAALPGQGLARFQFLEAIVRLAQTRIKSTSRPDLPAAVKQLMDDLELGQTNWEMRKTLHQALFNEECDVLVRNNKKMLEDCFALFTKRLPYPGRMGNGLMTYGAWQDFLTASNATKFGFPASYRGIAFTMGRQLHVDEYASFRFMELNFCEFLVAVAAVARLAMADDFSEDLFPDQLLDFLEEHVANTTLSPIRSGGVPHTGETHLEKLLTLVSEIFAEADEDNSGFLSFSEFNVAFRQQNVVQSLREYGIVEDDLRVLFTRVDADGSGTVSVEELTTGIVAMKKAMAGLDRAVAFLRKAFSDADKDGSGTLTKEEFHMLLMNPVVKQKLGSIGVSMQEVDDMWDSVDVSNPEGVTSHEMIAGLLALRDLGQEKFRGRTVLRQAFKQMDTNDSGSLTREEVEAAIGCFSVEEKLTRLGLSLPDVLAMYDQIDFNCDGEISYEELARGVSSLWAR